VQELKNRIQSGNYKIEPDKIADGMMREAVRDELAKRPVNIA
jgi:anti-sigma28 factor (negative regulator of flagellin synthesis)